MIKLLHVEDDIDILEIALIALQMSNAFEVLQFDNGRDALASISVFSPDVLLLDVIMPDMGGMELLNAFRNMPSFRYTPAIFLTACAQSDERLHFMQQGATGVIVKPFDPFALGDQVKALLDAC